MHEQVVEVHGVGREEQLLIHRPQPPGHVVDGPSPAGFERLGSQEVVLGPGDHPRDAVDRRVRQRQAQPLGGPLEHRRRVVGVEDRVVAREADLAGIPPQQPGREPVEGAHLHRLRPHQGRHPPAHLVGGLVGEGEGHDRSGRNPGRNQVGDAVGHHPGLPAPRACQHEQRPLDVGGRLPLGVVETVEEARRHCGFSEGLPASRRFDAVPAVRARPGRCVGGFTSL